MNSYAMSTAFVCQLVAAMGAFVLALYVGLKIDSGNKGAIQFGIVCGLLAFTLTFNALTAVREIVKHELKKQPNSTESEVRE